MLMKSPDTVGMEPGNAGLEKPILLGQNCKLSFILGEGNGILLPVLLQRVLAMISACMAPVSAALGIGNLVWESQPNPGWTVGYHCLYVGHGKAKGPHGRNWPQLHGDITSQRLLRFLAPLTSDGCDSWARGCFCQGPPVPMSSLVSFQDVQIDKEAGNATFSCFFSHFSNPWSYSLVLLGDAPNAI